MKYAIVARIDDQSASISDQLSKRLLNEGYTLDDQNPHTVFVVGGDGTFLYAVHKYLDQLDDINFIGIHTGTLGFLNDYRMEELDELLNDFLNKEPEIDKCRLLEIKTDKREYPYYALNEMRIENAAKTQIMDVVIDNVFFETFRGTGLCLATQIGSTAYNRSLKGAVIQHGLPLLELSEIAGIHHREFQSLGNSIILKEEAKVEFISDNFKGAALCFDNNHVILNDCTKITCKNSDKKVKIARYRPYFYLTRLKNLF